jgi:hypothetical protein
VRRSDLAVLGLGAVALVVGSQVGGSATLVAALATPPALVRAALVGGSAVLGLWFLAQAVARLRASGARADIGRVIRGVRLVFLSVGAFSAGAGWLVGHPLPIVLALVIAGVDVVETTFLLLLVGSRRLSGTVRGIVTRTGVE